MPADAPSPVTQELTGLNGWEVIEGKLVKTFEFTDFKHAFSWMARVAMAAEEACHHPEWTNVYNRVEVRLVTHDIGGISDKDFALAREMDDFFKA